jgi:class 3 adenylate cyclase
VLHEEGDYRGVTVNKAARVASAGRGGEIIASIVTAELAGRHGFEFSRPRTVALEGLDGVHQIVTLEWRQHDGAQTELHS